MISFKRDRVFDLIFNMVSHFDLATYSTFASFSHLAPLLSILDLIVEVPKEEEETKVVRRRARLGGGGGVKEHLFYRQVHVSYKVQHRIRIQEERTLNRYHHSF